MELGYQAVYLHKEDIVVETPLAVVCKAGKINSAYSNEE
jgi:hypothetical protein